MINLIPLAARHQLRAARMNTVLLRYCLLLLLTAGAIIASFGAGLWLTTQERTAAMNSRHQDVQGAAAYAQTKQTAAEFKANLKQAQAILSNQVSMYDLITRIAGLVPRGVILSNLSLGTASLTTPLAISAKAQTYDGAIQLKNNLADSHIFDSVSIVNTTTNSADSKQDAISGTYPIVITLSAQFGAQFTKGSPTGGIKP